MAVILVGLSIVIAACGEDDDGEATPSGSSERVALNACPEPDNREATGYHWNAKVAGISCEAVGRFIQESIFPPEATQQVVSESDFHVAGFDCVSQELSQEPGWRVSCSQASQRFVFDFTP